MLSNLIRSIAPRSCRLTAIPRLEELITHELTTTFLIAVSHSTPQRIAVDELVRVHPVMVTSSQTRPSRVLSIAALRQMASSPARMSQSLTRTRRQASMSMPSLLGIRTSLSMVMPCTRTSSHRLSRIVHDAPSTMHTPVIETRRTSRKWTTKTR